MMATPRCKMSPCRRYSPAPLACASSVSNAEQKPYLQMKKQAAVMQQLYTHTINYMADGGALVWGNWMQQ